MKKYNRPEINLEMFFTEDILTESGTVTPTNHLIIAVPQGSEASTLKSLQA